MKIRRVLLRNLHSIRSEVEIDFTKSPLSDVGLFAITGDTGAGKTTILDAITLAMYGDICRKAAPIDALSYGAEEGLAECEFEARERRFLAQWRVRTTRSKDPSKRLKTERSVAEWDEKTESFHIIVERKVREVNALIEGVTGLDFPRFTRSVLLAQGDFAAFLKASEKERSDLLERITGTEIYSELSKAALARRNIEQEQLTKLTTQREALHLLSSTELKEKETEQKEKKKADKEAQNALNEIKRQVGVLEKVELLSKQKEKLKIEKEQLQSSFEKLQPELEKFAVHQKISPLRPDLERLNDREDEAINIREEISKLQFEIEQLGEKKKLSDNKLAVSKNTSDELKKRQKDAFKLFDEIATLDEKISAKKEQFEKQKSNLEIGTKQLHRVEKEWIAIEKEIKEGKEKEALLEKWLNENKVAAALSKEIPLIRNYRETLREIYSSKIIFDKNISSQKTKLSEVEKAIGELDGKLKSEQNILEKSTQKFDKKTPGGLSASRHDLLEKLGREIESAGGTKERLSQLADLNETYSTFLSEANKLENELDSFRSEELSIDKELLTLIEACEEVESKLKFKREVYRQQLLVANFEQARSELKEGEECPVCLSTEHPFRSQKVEPFVDEAKSEMNHAEKRLKDLQGKRNTILKRHTEIATAIHRIDSSTNGQLRKINVQVLDLERKMAALLPHFGVHEFSLAHGDFIKDKLENFAIELKDKKELRESLSLLHNDILIQEKKVAKLSAERKDLEINQVSFRENLQANEKNFEEQKNKFERTTKELNALVKKYGYTFSVDSANLMFADLEKREVEYSERKNTLGNLQKKLALLIQKSGQLKSSKKELSEKIKVENALSKNQEKELNQLIISRLENFDKKNPKLEREFFLKKMEEADSDFSLSNSENEELKSNLKVAETTMKDRNISLSKLEVRIKSIKQKLEKKLEDFGFNNFVELQSALLAEDEVKRIQSSQENLRKRQIETEQDSRNLELEWKKAHKESLPEKPIIDLKSEVEILEKKSRDIQQQIGAIQQQLSDNEKRGEEAKRLLDDIEKQRAEFNRWNNLYDLIGSSDGKKFRVFAQGLTLQKLVQLANQHLSQLHGRYFIIKRPGEDLELDIVDTYQAENTRSMHTLSGGESFLVSLALALGLSDLAGRNANIRSLFIDEGFGTLDDQALDVAITTLENLQSSGKTIGVISHVKELKERISAQVRLVKKGGGVSEVEII